MENNNSSALALRIGLGLFFLVFGLLKFVSSGPMMGNVYPSFFGPLAVEAIIYILGGVQIVGAVLLLIGLFTVPVSIVVGVMHLGTVIATIGRIVTPFTFPEGGPPNFLFFGAIPILAAIIALVLIGPGEISVDRRRR